VEVFDGSGFATIAQIVAVNRDQVVLVAEGPPITETSPSCFVTLATAIPKGERFDWLVEKVTELGVEALIPLVTERSVVDPGEMKLQRLRRTIVEASKQSRRNRLMILHPARAWADLVRSAAETFALRLIATPHGLPPSRWPALTGTKRVLLAVGPEGGFSPTEESLARSEGWHAIQISPNVLRIETAALAGTVAIMTRSPENQIDERS
jgi:16S rRNA (uracil1498-N3)-methyltransferase